jgi:anti-anti-sigma factor
MAVYRDVARAAFIRQSIGDDEYVHVFGEVDIESEDDFRAAIRDAAGAAKRVVVDLSRCTYIGSQGFAVLANEWALSNIVVIASPAVKRLMGILGLNRLLTTPPNAF